MFDNVWSLDLLHQTDLGYLLKIQTPGLKLNKSDSKQVGPQAKNK